MPNRRRHGGRMYINPDVAAAGSTQADAAFVYEGFTVVTGADGTKGVILTNVKPGSEFFIKGTTAGVLKVYPPLGGQINAIAANGAMSLASGAIPARFFAKSALQLYTTALVPA